MNNRTNSLGLETTENTDKARNIREERQKGNDFYQQNQATIFTSSAKRLRGGSRKN